MFGGTGCEIAFVNSMCIYIYIPWYIIIMIYTYVYIHLQINHGMIIINGMILLDNDPPKMLG